MSIYAKSEKDKPIIIRRPIATTTTIEAYGSGDNYTTPFDLFGDDETIRVMGTVVAANGADLSTGILRLQLSGGFPPVNVPMTFAAGVNSYQYDLGMLVESDYTVTATFQRLRVTPRPGAEVEIIYLDEYEPSSATITISATKPDMVQSFRAARTLQAGLPSTQISNFLTTFACKDSAGNVFLHGPLGIWPCPLLRMLISYRPLTADELEALPICEI